MRGGMFAFVARAMHAHCHEEVFLTLSRTTFRSVRHTTRVPTASTHESSVTSVVGRSEMVQRPPETVTINECACSSSGDMYGESSSGGSPREDPGERKIAQLITDRFGTKRLLCIHSSYAVHATSVHQTTLAFSPRQKSNKCV